MSDLAKAVARGDILVDEIDVIEAVKEGRLSRSDGARFSSLMEEFSKSYERFTNLPENIIASIQETPQKPTKWEEVLVDEVDFIKAVKTGRISKDDCHIASINKDFLEELSGDADEVKISFHDEIFTDDLSEPSSIDVLI